jgi:hypothetical protein
MPTGAMTEPLGGDPAWWIDRNCEECGRLMEDDVAHHCPVLPRRDQGGEAAEAQALTARVPEMAAARMPPRGQSNLGTPERPGELVVRGSSTRRAMPCWTRRPTLRLATQELDHPVPGHRDAGHRGVQPDRRTTHGHTRAGSHRVANKCVVTKRQGVDKRQAIARKCTTRIPRGV